MTARKPHVMVVGHRVNDMLFGAERSLLDVLTSVDRRTYDTSCVLPRANAAYLSALAGQVGNVEVFPYPWGRGTWAIDEEVVARFETVFRSARVDLVHVNTITLLEPLLAARRAGVPSVLHAREIITQDRALSARLGAGAPDIVRSVSEAADFIIANSDATHRLYRKDGRSFRVYNGVDVGHLDIPNELEPGRLKVGIVSSNEPNKGIDRFIRLATLASRRRPELQFSVIGPRTPYVVGLERAARAAAPSVKLSVTDYVADPVDAIRRVNVVVSFSLVAESFGRTVVEAMAARRPVIAYRWGALPELIRDGVDGFLIPYLGIAEALAHLGDLADQPERVLEMGRHGRERAERMFSRAVFAARLNEVYGRIIELSSGRPNGRT